jgi:hypothetical protein
VGDFGLTPVFYKPFCYGFSHRATRGDNRHGQPAFSLKSPQKVENGDAHRFCNPKQKRCFPVVFPLLGPANSFKNL